MAINQARLLTYFFTWAALCAVGVSERQRHFSIRNTTSTTFAARRRLKSSENAGLDGLGRANIEPQLAKSELSNASVELPLQNTELSSNASVELPLQNTELSSNPTVDLQLQKSELNSNPTVDLPLQNSELSSNPTVSELSSNPTVEHQLQNSELSSNPNVEPRLQNSELNSATVETQLQNSKPSRDASVVPQFHNSELRNASAEHQSHNSEISSASIEPQSLKNISDATPVPDLPQNNASLPEKESKESRPIDQTALRRAARRYQHVSISGRSYFGGMETIFHSYLSSQICRIYNPCFKYDGTLVLQTWLQRHDVTLSRYCGVQKVEFTLPDTSPPSLEPPEDVDLFGIETLRHHLPNFLIDVMPGIVALDTVFGNYLQDRRCYTRMGSSCSYLPSKLPQKPAVFLDRRAKKVTAKGSWVRQLLELATPKAVSEISVKHWANVFWEGEKGGLKCFRSAYVSKPWSPSDGVKPELFNRLNLFSASRIPKMPRQYSEMNLALGDDTPSTQVCTLAVTIINRKPIARQPDRIIGRYIPNIPVIREETFRLAAQSPDLNISFKAVRLEERPLKWQIHAMKKTDILVGGHGSGLTNMVFMRSQSSVLEIQPFGYYATTYETLAGQLANFRYDFLVAKPDPEAFYACLDHFYKPGAPDYEAAMAIGKRFKKSTEEYEKSTQNTHSLTIHNLEAKFTHVGICAEMQQLKVDPTLVADAIVSLAKAACKRRQEY